MSPRRFFGNHPQPHRHQRILVMLHNIRLLHRTAKIAPLPALQRLPLAHVALGTIPPGGKNIAASLDPVQIAPEIRKRVLARV